jgi:hypothetical protein
MSPLFIKGIIGFRDLKNYLFHSCSVIKPLHLLKSIMVKIFNLIVNLYVGVGTLGKLQPMSKYWYIMKIIQVANNLAYFTGASMTINLSFNFGPVKKQYVLKMWNTSRDVSLSLCLPSSSKGC